MLNLKFQISNDKGQAILALILIMTVALAIGLSVVQKSLVDVSTSTKVEESSRAFSAAEAGIEKSLQSGGNTSVSFSENASSANVVDSNLIPAIPAADTRQDPLEYPPLAKEEVAHVWLSDPAASLPNCVAPFVCYTQTSLDVYWGDPTASDKAALELTLVYYGTDSTDLVDPLTTKYRSKKWYLDQKLRDPANNFDTTSANCSGAFQFTNKYQCKYTLTGLSPQLMLIRARLLYNSTSQPFAVQAVGTDVGHYIPPQARILTSTGISGETQRRVQVFQIQKVVPPYFDYAIFSLGAISK